MSMLLLGGSAYGQMVTTFDYTGGMQTYVVPAGVTNLDVEVIAAQGGNAVGTTVGWGGGPMDLDGGMGGNVTCTISVTGGETLNIFVGGIGDMTTGGYNGGGNPAACSGTEVIAAGGGGASDIRQGGSTVADRIVVAGGGGGAAGSADPSYASPDFSGAGGGLTGANATVGSSGLCTPGGGGGPASGGIGGNNACWCGGALVANSGILGFGGDGICAPSGLSTCSCSGTGCTTGGGGGGGYYGGGAGICFAGGGGGSSYTNATATSVVHTQGFQLGDGQIIITVLCDPLVPTISDDTLCDGDMVTLSVTSTNAGTITWDMGVTDGVAFTPPLGTTAYTATSSDVADCGFQQLIFVGAIPTVDAGADVNVCEGDSASLSGSGTANIWTWDGGITDGVNFLPPPATTTTYTLTGEVDSTGCQATDMVDVTVVVPDISITATGTTLISNQSSASYQWLDCPAMTPIAGAVTQIFTPTADGSYAVIVTVLGCSDTSACQAVFSGIDNISGSTDLVIYPNPTDGLLQIALDASYNYELINLVGEVIFSGEASGKKELDLSTIASGTYFIKVSVGKEVKTMKVVRR